MSIFGLVNPRYAVCCVVGVYFMCNTYQLEAHFSILTELLRDVSLCSHIASQSNDAKPKRL